MNGKLKHDSRFENTLIDRGYITFVKTVSGFWGPGWKFEDGFKYSNLDRL